MTGMTAAMTMSRMMPIPDFVHGLDVIWLVAASAGAMFSLHELWDTYIDRQVLLASNENGLKLIIANANIYGEQLRLMVQVLLLAAALLQVVLPMEMVEPMIPVKMLGFRLLLLLSTVGLTIKSYMHRRMRVQLLSYWLLGKDETP